MDEGATRPYAADAKLSEIREKRAEILQIARRHKAEAVRVFGSVARDDATAESDIDFLVTMAADATLVDLIALEQALTGLLGRPVDVLTEDAIDPSMREDPRDTAVAL